MDPGRFAELLSRDGQVLARGRVDPAGDARLAFHTPDGSPRLVSYFFVASERFARLRVDQNPPVTVRLETRWSGGCRRWELLPDDNADDPRRRPFARAVRNRMMTFGSRLPLGRNLHHASPFHR